MNFGKKTMQGKMKNMSDYKIQFSDFYTVKKIPKIAKKMINEAIINRLMKNPNEYGKPLSGNLKNHLRLRVSYYIIVYHVDEQNKTVTIKAMISKRILEVLNNWHRKISFFNQFSL